jgi:hypothetical protein
MFEALKIVATAVTTNGSQITLTAILLTIVIFIYSVFAYLYVLDTFWNDSFDGGENQCTSVRHCFFTVFSLVLSDNAGAKVYRQHRRHDRAAVVPRGQQDRVLRALRLRPEHLLHSEHARPQHHLRHHHPELRANARAAQPAQLRHREYLLHLLDAPL